MNYKKMSFIIFYLLIGILTKAQQTDTLYFDHNWEKTTKKTAYYYRPKPTRVPLNQLLEKGQIKLNSTLDGVDSLYFIKDYYSKNDSLQYTGYWKDADNKNYRDNEGRIIWYKEKWYGEDEIKPYSPRWVEARETYQKTDYCNNNKRSFLSGYYPIYYIDYSFVKGHLLRAGLEFKIYDADDDTSNKLFLGIGYGLTNNPSKIQGIGDLHLTYNIQTLLFIKAGTSQYHAYALAGISLLNMADLGIGYSKSYQNSNLNIQGFTAGITVRLTNKDNVYGRLDIGF